MKVLAVFSLLVLAALADLADERKAVEKILKECQKEYGGPIDICKKMRNNEPHDKKQAGKLLLCVTEREGYLCENGNIKEKEFKEKIARLTDCKDTQKEIFEDCSKCDKGDCPGEKAYNVIKCLQKHTPNPYA